jgi:hypothetical protein
MNKISLFMVLWLGMASAAFAHPEYMKPTGASDCTACHNDKFGNGFKPGVLAAAYSSEGGLIAGLKHFIEEQEEEEEEEDSSPILSPINNQWNVTVGEAPLLIPLRVYDDENDSFVIHGSAPSGYRLSNVYTDEASELPSIDYEWRPTTSQANKIYTVSFYAQETGSSRSLKSNTITASVRVWSARTSATKNVSQFIVQNAQWTASQLILTGKVIFKATVTAAQRTAALNTLLMTLQSGSGKVIGSPLKLKLSTDGSWRRAIPLTGVQVPCSIRLNYEGLNAIRTVKQSPTTCVK